MTSQTKADLTFIAINLITGLTMIFMVSRCCTLSIEPGNVTEFLLSRGIPCVILALYVILLIALSVAEEQAARRRKGTR